VSPDVPRTTAALILILTWPAPLFLAYSAATGAVSPLGETFRVSGVLQPILFFYVGWGFVYRLFGAYRLASPPSFVSRIVIFPAAFALVVMPILLALSSAAPPRFVIEFLLWIASGAFGGAWWAHLRGDKSPEFYTPDFSALSSKQRLSALSRHIERHPSDADALVLRATEYVERGAYELALKDIETGLRTGADRRDRFLHLRHRVHLIRKQFEPALADILEALDCGPDGFRDHYHFAASLRSKLGQPEEALRILDQAVATLPRDPMAYLRRAELLGAQGRIGPASDDLDTALSLARARSDEAALLERIKVLMRLAQFHQALTGCNELIVAQPNDLRLHALGLFDLRSDIHTALGNLPAAKADSDKARELSLAYR